MDRSWRTKLIVGIVVGILAGCFPQATPVAQFSRTYSCPLHRIALTPRPDVSKHMLLCAAHMPAPNFELAWCGGPPAEIAQDPGRVAVWTSLRDDKFAAVDQGSTFFEAIGCGERHVYMCSTYACAEGLTP